MTSLLYIEDRENEKVWSAIVASIAIHALVVIMYPHLKHIQIPVLPEKLEIEFFTMKMPASNPSPKQIAPSAVASVQPESQKTTSLVKPQTAPSVEDQKTVITSSASNDSNFRVPEQVLSSREESAKQPASTPHINDSTDKLNHAPSDSVTKESRSSVSTSAPVSYESEELAASDNDAWGDYGEQLRALVHKSKQYPAIAIRRHLEGEVAIIAQFVRGELTQVALAESSSHAVLDEEALRMVKKAVDQLGIKESLRKKTFKITIPVSFKLE